MQWRGRRQSGNVVDRRGMKAGGALAGGGIVFAILYAVFTGDVSVLVDDGRVGAGGQRGAPADDDHAAFISVVLADTEDVWNEIFREAGARYAEPRLVLFRGRVQSACGSASSAVGPFYCPADRQIYLDLGFFDALARQLGARGDFAQAYVVAHEVGHHVQNLIGGLDAKGSVQVELQADCFAGVWARRTHEAKGVLEEGDLEEAIGAAEAVGDDRLQQRAGGEVMPDSFTHGTSAQRAAAFRQGFDAGSPEACAI